MDADRGLGAVVRDIHGALLTAGVKQVCALWPRGISELAVTVDGIELAIFLGYSSIHLEGDSLNVMNCISRKPTGHSLFFLLDRLHQLVLSLFGFRSSVVRRSGNITTHMIAH